MHGGTHCAEALYILRDRFGDIKSNIAKNDEEKLLMSEVKLLLAEKRTYLAMFRTGVAIFGLSLTALGVLVLGSNPDTGFLASNITVIGILLIVIAITGGWLIYRSRQRISRIDEMIEHIEDKNKRIADIVI